MSPNQHLQLIIDRNRLKLRGGMFGGKQVIVGPYLPETWKRKAAEELICLRENRSVLQMLGRPHSGAAAIKLARIRSCIARAKLMADEERQAAAEPMRMAAE